MEVIKESTKRYYDPELVSLLLTALAALGSVAAIVGGTLQVIEYNNLRQEKKDIKEKTLHYKHSIQKEVRYTLHSLSSSVENIDYELRTLEDIYHISQKVRQNSNIKFGNGSMWLERYQFERFYCTQTRIVEEARNIYSDLKLVEELLLTGEDKSLIWDLGCNVKMRHMIEEETLPVNYLISKFGDISVEEFISESIKICCHTRFIVKRLEDNLEENLRKNYM